MDYVLDNILDVNDIDIEHSIKEVLYYDSQCGECVTHQLTQAEIEKLTLRFK